MCSFEVSIEMLPLFSIVFSNEFGGWCYCQVADGIATVGWWMLSGWCYYHWAGVIAWVNDLTSI